MTNPLLSISFISSHYFNFSATSSSLSSSSSVETISSSGIGGGKNNTAPLAPLVPLSRLSSSSSSSSVSTSVSQPSSSTSGGGGLSSSSTDNNSNNTVVSNQLSMMSTMDFSNGLGGGLGGSSSMSSFNTTSSGINSVDALDDENHGSSSTYLIDDALDKLDPSAIAWGIPDEDEWSQNVLRTPQGFGDTPYEKTMENDVEPGIPEEEQKGLERMRGLGMPDRYGIVSGGNYDESVQRTLPRGILVNKMLMRVGGLPLRLLDPGTEEAEEVMKQGGSIIVIEGGEGDDGRHADGGGLVEDDKSIVKVEAKPNVTTLDAEKSVGPGGSMMVIGDDDAPPGSDLNVNVGVPPVLSAVTIDAPLPKVDGIEIDSSSSSSSSSIVSVTENSSSSTSTGAPIRVKVRRPIRWIDQDENAGPALASKNHFAPCSTYTLNGLVAVRFFDFQTHIVEDPKKAQRAAASAALSSMTSTVAAAEVIVDDAMNATSSETSSSTSSSQSTGDENGGSGAISFEEARKREKSREKSLLATVGSSSTTSTPKKKVLEYQYSSPNTATMTIVPACSAKVSKGWLSPLGPPKLKAPARTPFVSAEAARIEKEMQTNAALKAQLMGQRYIGGRGGAAPVLNPFAWKDKNKIDADPELVTDGLVSSSAVSRSGVSGGAAGGAGVDLSSVQKVFEHIKVRWQFGLFGSGVGGVSNGLMMNPQQLFVQQKFQLQQQAQQQALQLAQQQQQLLLQQQQLQQQIQMQQQLSASGVAVASTTTTTTAATTTSSAGVPSSLSLDTASASAVNAPSSSTATAMAVTPTPVSMSMPMMLFPNAASTMPALSLARPSSVVPTLQQGFFGNSSVTATTTPMMMMMGIGGGVTPATSISGVGKKPCMFFQSKAGCRNGVKCPYLHDPAYKAPQEDFNRISAADKKGHVPQVVVVGNNSNLGGTGVATTASVPQQMQQQPQQQPQMATQGQGWGIQPHWMQQQVQQQQQPQVYMQQPQQQQHLQPVGWGIQPQSLPQQQQQQQPVGWGIQPQPQQMQMQQPPQVYAQQPGMWPPQQQGHPLPQQQQHQQQMMMMPQSGWSGPVMSVPQQQQQQQQQQPQQGWNSGWAQGQPPPM